MNDLRPPPPAAPSGEELGSDATPGERRRDSADSGDAGHTVADQSVARPAGGGPSAGAQVGPYCIEGRVGHGGMGEVYAAYDARLDRRVAIKLLHPMRAGSKDTLRMQREGRALARLRHPNVVSVYDVGEHDGRGFIAMEFVEGKTLSAWCREEPPVQARIDAMLQVGEALIAAHKAGLIHRDLKPANVILESATQRVLVVDFGVARLESTPGTPAPVAAANDITTVGVLGTPAYMAPEQLEGERATQHNDQFAYCVTFWELLHGQRPFVGRHSIELHDAIMAQKLPDFGADGVPRELDALLARGLAAEPAERHESMQALVAELRPFSSHHRDDRSKAKFAMGSALVFVLGLGAAGIYQSQRGPGELESCIGSARERAQVLTRSESWGPVETAFTASKRPHAADTLARLREGFAARASTWGELHERACADTYEARTHTPQTLESRVACLARPHKQLQETLLLLADAKARPELVDKALELLRAVPDGERCFEGELAAPRGSAEAQVIALIDAAARERITGDFDDAQEKANTAVQDAAALDDDIQAEALLTRGYIEDARGDYDAAEVSLSEAVNAAAKAQRPRLEARAALQLMRVLGDRKQDFEAAERWYALAEGRMANLSADDVLKPRLAWYRGQVLRRANKPKEARAVLEAALAQLEARSGDRVELAGVLTDLGMAIDDLGDYEASGAFLERSVVLREEIYGPQHPQVANALANLAVFYGRKGQSDKALATNERAIASTRASLGPDHPNLGTLNNNRAIELQSLGRFDEALAAYDEALRIRRAALGETHPSVAQTLGNRGYTLQQLNRCEEAVGDLQLAISYIEKASGPDAHDLTPAIGNLANCYIDLKRFDEGFALLGRAIRIGEKAFGLEHPEVGVNSHNLGDAYLNAERCEEALPHFERAIAIFEKAFEADHYNISYPSSSLGTCLLRLGRLDDAVPVLERAQSIRQAKPGPAGLKGQTALTLARALVAARKDRNRAEDLARQGLMDLKSDASVTPESRAEEAAWVAATFGG